MKLRINGQDRDFPALDSNPFVSNLISLLEMKADRIAVERNGEIVPRTAWGDTPVADSDKLEIVQFVGGGSTPVATPAYPC